MTILNPVDVCQQLGRILVKHTNNHQSQALMEIQELALKPLTPEAMEVVEAVISYTSRNKVIDISTFFDRVMIEKENIKKYKIKQKIFEDEFVEQNKVLTVAEQQLKELKKRKVQS